MPFQVLLRIWVMSFVRTRFLTTQGWRWVCVQRDRTIWFVESEFGKAWPWMSNDDLFMIYMEAHSKVGLACIAKPYTNIVWKVSLLGLSPRSVSFLPFFFFYGVSPFFLALFPFYTSISFPFFIYVSVSPYLGQLLVLSIFTSEWLGKAG